MSNVLVESINYDVLKYKYVKEFCEYLNENFNSRKSKFLRFWGIGTEKTVNVEDVYMDCLKVRNLSSKNEELNKDIVDFIVKNSMAKKVQLTLLDLTTASTISSSEQQSRVTECLVHYPEYTQKAWNKWFKNQKDIDMEL